MSAVAQRTLTGPEVTGGDNYREHKAPDREDGREQSPLFDSFLPPDELLEQNRKIVRNTSEATIAEIVSERSDLAYRSLTGELSPREERRLKLLEWQLDQIEDAKFGGDLDVLRDLVGAQSQIAQKIAQFVETAESVRKRRRK